MTSRAQKPLVRGRIHSENLTFKALLCEQMKNEKRASDDETKKHSRTSPEIQFKELNEKQRKLYLTSRSIPAKTKTKSSQKTEKQTIKQSRQKYTHC